MEDLSQFKKKRVWHMSASQNIMLGFAGMILVGAILLALPIASKSGESVGFLNALFTATSANCVTGLVVVNTMAHWTVFGKAIILLLIQFGGLGFMTVMTMAMIVTGQRISLRNRLTIQASFNQDSIGGMVRLVSRVIASTLIFEGCGAVLLALSFYFTAGMSWFQSLYNGIFHAISAFCNAGFDILTESSLVPYQSNWSINLIIMALIVAGGTGFTVWAEIYSMFKVKKSLRSKITHMSLHSKIAITVTTCLLVGGTLIFLLFEYNNPETMGSMSCGDKILASTFQSVTLRTAGFNSIPQDGLTETSKMFSCLLMLIGGSPASTAGGIKTVTLGLIIISMISGFKGKNKLEAFGRTLPLDLLQKALTVTTIMIIVFTVSTTLLYFTEQNTEFPHSLLDLMFETASAAGTVGVTAGITPYLSSPGKVILITCMYLGRLSPMTVVVALNSRLHSHTDGISYPQERVIIG